MSTPYQNIEEQTYRGLIVPDRIHANRIISAFDNLMDEESLDYYREKDVSMVEPILGYPELLTEDDVGNFFISGEEITEEHIGEKVWFVTDGHRRATIGVEQGVNIPTKLDYSCIVDKEDLERYERIENGVSSNMNMEPEDTVEDTVEQEGEIDSKKKKKTRKPKL